MIQTGKVKRVVASGLGLGLLVAVSVVLITIGALVLKLGTGADPAEAFLEIPEVPETYEALVSWGPDPVDLARPMEPATRDLVESAWVRSWITLDRTHRTGDSAGLEVWYLQELGEHARGSAETGTPAAIIQHGHELDVTFYSVDGSILTFEATSDLERIVTDGPSMRAQEGFDVVMLLADGNWRVLHLTRTGAVPVPVP